MSASGPNRKVRLSKIGNLDALSSTLSGYLYLFSTGAPFFPQPLTAARIAQDRHQRAHLWLSAQSLHMPRVPAEEARADLAQISKCCPDIKLDEPFGSSVS